MKAVAAVAAVAGAAIAATAGVTATGRIAPAAQKPCMPQASQQAHAPPVGRLLKVDPDAALGKSSLAATDRRAIGKDSTLCTYPPFGQIKFVVNPRVTCWMDPGSRVRVYPTTKKGSQAVVVRFEDGDSTWCNTGTATKDSRFEANTGKVRLIMRDPLFSVGVDRKHTVTVRVQLGYVEVSKPGGGGAVVVGPGQQVDVPNGGRPAGVTPIVLTADDNDRIATLSPLAPAPDFSRPDGAKSPGLEDIYRRGVLRVVYESDADAATATFVRAFFEFLANSWKVKLSLTARTPDEIGAGLGTFDVAAAHDPGLAQKLVPVPVLTGPSGVSWLALHRVDPYLDAALIAFVAADVASGGYGDLYRAAYPSAEPDYTGLRRILVGG